MPYGCVRNYMRLGSACAIYGRQNMGFSHSHVQWIIVDLDKYICRVDCYVFLFNSMKGYKGVRGIAPLIRNVGTRWRWVVNFRTATLTPRKNPGFYRRWGLVICSAGLDVLEKRKISCPYGDSNPGWSIGKGCSYTATDVVFVPGSLLYN